MRVIIDRFEGDFAICEKEDRSMLQIQKARLPDEAKEGDVLLVEDHGITIDQEGTQTRTKQIQNMMNSLWE